jgi:hypothetical protein
MHSHIAVINEDNKVIAVVKLGDQFKERLATAISEETGELLFVDQFMLPEPSAEMIRYQAQLEVSLEGYRPTLYLAPTWEY